MVGVGGFFIMGGGLVPHTFPQVLGALSVLLAFVNVSGGFVITKRMLDMFRRPTDPPEYPWLYGIPAILFGGGYIAAASTGMAGLVQAGYLASSLLCIGSLSGLASQATARQGNILGILGVSSGILASLGAVGFPTDVLMQFGGVAGIGALIGIYPRASKIFAANSVRFNDRSTDNCYGLASDSCCPSLRRWSGCSSYQ